METNNINLIITNKSRSSEENEMLSRVCTFLQMEMPNLTEQSFDRAVKELCVIRLCKAIGIRNIYNCKNKFFKFYATVSAQAVSDILNLKLVIAPAELRFVKYNGINFVNRIKDYLQNEDMDEAMIEAFDLIDDNKDIVEKIISGTF